MPRAKGTKRSQRESGLYFPVRLIARTEAITPIRSIGKVFMGCQRARIDVRIGSELARVRASETPSAPLTGSGPDGDSPSWRGTQVGRRLGPTTFRLLVSAFVLMAGAAMAGSDVVRVPIPAKDVTKIFPPGTELRILSAREFESQVEAAHKRSIAERPAAAPRLIRARHRARWDSGLLRGRSELVIGAVPAGPAEFPLEPWTPAILVGPGGAPAVGARDTGAAVLRVEASPREQAVRLDWELQPRPHSRGRGFSLGLPADATTVLVLELPRGWVASSQRGVRRGPLPAEDPSLALWEIDGESGRFDIELRDPRDLGKVGAGSGAWMSATTEVDLRRTADQAGTMINWTADCRLELDPRHPGRMVVELDPGLELIDVQGAAVQGYRTERPGRETRVTVTLAEGTRVANLRFLAHVASTRERRLDDPGVPAPRRDLDGRADDRGAGRLPRPERVSRAGRPARPARAGGCRPGQSAGVRGGSAPIRGRSGLHPAQRGRRLHGARPARHGRRAGPAGLPARLDPAPGLDLADGDRPVPGLAARPGPHPGAGRPPGLALLGPPVRGDAAAGDAARLGAGPRALDVDDRGDLRRPGGPRPAGAPARASPRGRDRRRGVAGVGRRRHDDPPRARTRPGVDRSPRGPRPAHGAPRRRPPRGPRLAMDGPGRRGPGRPRADRPGSSGVDPRPRPPRDRRRRTHHRGDPPGRLGRRRARDPAGLGRRAGRCAGLLAFLRRGRQRPAAPADRGAGPRAARSAGERLGARIARQSPRPRREGHPVPGDGAVVVARRRPVAERAPRCHQGRHHPARDPRRDEGLPPAHGPGPAQSVGHRIARRRPLPGRIRRPQHRRAARPDRPRLLLHRARCPAGTHHRADGRRADARDRPRGPAHDHG